MKGERELNFKLEINLKAVVNEKSVKSGDAKALIYINRLVKEFLKSPKERLSFYLENLLGLFFGCNLFDIVKAAFKPELSDFCG